MNSSIIYYYLRQKQKEKWNWFSFLPFFPFFIEKIPVVSFRSEIRYLPLLFYFFFATTLVEYFCQFIHFPLIWMVKPFLSLFCKKTLPFVVIINIWLTQIFWLCSWIIERIFYYYYWIIASIVLIVWNCQFTLHLRFLVLIIDCVYCL